MSPQPTPTGAREIVWPSVVTVISAAILIGAEVFGAAFAGGWALALLFGLDDTGAHILQAVLFAIGVLIMWRSSARLSASSRSSSASEIRGSRETAAAQAPKRSRSFSSILTPVHV